MKMGLTKNILHQEIEFQVCSSQAVDLKQRFFVFVHGTVKSSDKVAALLES